MNRLIRYTYPHRANFNHTVLDNFETELGRLFNNALADFAPIARSPRFPVDLYADNDNTYVRAELPGVAREDIKLEIVDGHLTINATRKENEETLTFNRTIALSDVVQADKITAAYANGVLTVTLPKQEEAKPRKIDITVN